MEINRNQLHQFFCDLESLATDLSKVNSSYRGDYGEGYDTGCYNSANSLQELIDHWKIELLPQKES